MSRAPVDCADEPLENEAIERASVFITITEFEQIAAFQEQDERVKYIKSALINYASTGNFPDSKEIDPNEFRRYELTDDIIYRVPDEAHRKRRFVLPKSMRKAMCIKYHDNMGHYSADKVVEKIAEKYWFPGMRRYVRQHVKRCIDCIIYKGNLGKEAGKLHSMEPDRRPFRTIQMDHVGPFVKSTNGNTHVLVIEDSFSRFIELYPVPDTSVKTALEKLKEFTYAYGLPKRTIADRGSAFTSYQFGDFCARNNIRRTLISVRRPQANRLVERMNRVIVPQIRIYCERKDQGDWDAKMTMIRRNINAGKNRSTGKTPFELVFGFQPEFDASALTSVWNEDDNQPVNHEVAWVEARERILESQSANKRYYDQRHCNGEKLEVGQIVFIRYPPTSTGKSTKLQPRYRGSMAVTKLVAPDIYEVLALVASAGEYYRTNAHISHIRTLGNDFEEEDEIDDTEESS